jgi:hypothetical protein
MWLSAAAVRNLAVALIKVVGRRLDEQPQLIAYTIYNEDMVFRDVEESPWLVLLQRRVVL